MTHLPNQRTWGRKGLKTSRAETQALRFCHPSLDLQIVISWNHKNGRQIKCLLLMVPCFDLLSRTPKNKSTILRESANVNHFWREHPPNHGTGLLILGQHFPFVVEQWKACPFSVPFGLPRASIYDPYKMGLAPNISP